MNAFKPHLVEQSLIATNRNDSYPLTQLARAAKVNDFDSRPLWITQEDVFWLEVAMDDTQFRRREEKQCCAQLLSKLARQVERDAAKVGVAQ